MRHRRLVRHARRRRHVRAAHRGPPGHFADVLIAFAAGSFLYIAASDLVPALQRTRDLRTSVLQVAFMLSGMGLMTLLTLLET